MYYQFHNYIRVPIVRVYRDTSMDVMYSKTYKGTHKKATLVELSCHV